MPFQCLIVLLLVTGSVCCSASSSRSIFGCCTTIEKPAHLCAHLWPGWQEIQSCRSQATSTQYVPISCESSTTWTLNTRPVLTSGDCVLKPSVDGLWQAPLGSKCKTCTRQRGAKSSLISWMKTMEKLGIEPRTFST